jgi:hypothetical protein
MKLPGVQRFLQIKDHKKYEKKVKGHLTVYITIKRLAAKYNRILILVYEKSEFKTHFLK